MAVTMSRMFHFCHKLQAKLYVHVIQAKFCARSWKSAFYASNDWIWMLGRQSFKQYGHYPRTNESQRYAV